jgi:hypothetical protein
MMLNNTMKCFKWCCTADNPYKQEGNFSFCRHVFAFLAIIMPFAGRYLHIVFALL